MDKKGATFQSFWEVMIILVAFVACLTIIGSNMNSIYNQNQDLSFGIASNETQNKLVEASNKLEADSPGGSNAGTAGTTSLGLFTLTTIPSMMSTMFSLVKDLVMGTWIANLVNLMNLGAYGPIVIVLLQILYFGIIIFIIMKLILRINV